MNEEIENALHREGLILANINKRVVAFFIDEILLSFLLIIAISDSFSNAKTAEEMIILTNNFMPEYLIMGIVYRTFFVIQYGATLGKIAMKIRVIEITTLQNPSFLCSLNRAIFHVISEIFFYLGFLWGVIDSSRQTWHDKTAKTLVVNA